MPQRTYLFIHQNMPAQFMHLCVYLRDRGEKVVFLTRNNTNVLSRVYKGVYELAREPNERTHPYLQSTEGGVLHGQAVYRFIANLLKQGIKPDIVIGHSGWGETLFVKDILPNTPLLTYFEFFYRFFGQDMNFDPEYKSDVDSRLSLRLKNCINLLAGDSTDWGITPTNWQFSTYPEHFRSKMSIIHEGIDTRSACPSKSATFTTASGKALHPGSKVVTFVSRNLEPYRGLHIFMRAIPDIQRRHPDAEILIVGAEGRGYGRKLAEGCSYKRDLLAEVSMNLDKVHFTDTLPSQSFRAALQVSSAHVYLTYPFVLSWSMLEAMAMGCLVIGSRTPPVEEVVIDKQNGLLVDFFDVRGLADLVCEALARPSQFEPMRKAARETIIARYDLETVSLPRQSALLNWMMRNF
jgi:glycosyltransferase involved in cell wall biosynthesis